jgi:hypothetical protein
MVMIANLQYGWTLFINPIDEKYHWGRAAIQVAFTIFIVTETWAQPFGGLLDRPLRPEARDLRLRSPGRHRLGHQFRRRFAHPALPLRRHA